MRTSLIAGLLMIALLAFGLRASMRESHVVRVAEVARAQPGPDFEAPKGPPAPPKVPEAPKAPDAPKELKERGRSSKLVISRGPLPPPVWKTEIVGDPKTSADAARRDALDKAARELHVWAAERFPSFQYWPTPKFLTDHRLVDETPAEERVLANTDAPTMFVQKVNLQLSDHQLSLLLQEDRRVHSAERLWFGGRILGGVVIALLALIGYVRLDDWTKGYFSTVLKFVAIALAVAGVLIAVVA